MIEASPDWYTARFNGATLSIVRKEVARYLAASGLAAERCDEVVIAVGEVLANAVEHGGGRGEIELRRADHEMRCVVIDNGPGVPQDFTWSRPADPLAEYGRGLWLARTLCADLTLQSSPVGTRVALVVDIP